MQTRLNDTLRRIVEVDNQIRFLVRTRKVITLADIGNFRELKTERRMLVGSIQAAAKFWREQQ
jgi:hypothetical protein